VTDRHAGYVVVLDHDIREDDAETILSAIRMVKGVQDVVPIVSDFAVHIAESRARTEYAQVLMDSIKRVLNESH
jgi:hypothetical protein